MTSLAQPQPIPGPFRTDGRRHPARSIAQAVLMAAELRGLPEETTAMLKSTVHKATTILNNAHARAVDLRCKGTKNRLFVLSISLNTEATVRAAIAELVEKLDDDRELATNLEPGTPERARLSAAADLTEQTIERLRELFPEENVADEQPQVPTTKPANGQPEKAADEQVAA